MTIERALKDVFEERFLEQESMSRHTNFRIGGPAKFFVEAKTEDEIVAAVKMAQENHVPFFALGGGSNLLVADKGYDGLVIKLALRDIKIDGTTVTAGAGVISTALARAAAKAGLEGLEWAISLPGTIGGAVRGNAGCFGGETREHLGSVRVLRIPPLPEGGIGGVGAAQVKVITRDELAFDYRHSVLKEGDDIVLSATFKLEKGDANDLEKKMQELLGKRKATQPLYAGSAGCVFKNPLKDGVRISAGKLIDEAELKGQQIGDAKISEEHGNFIVNMGHATADQVLQLIAFAKTRVRDRFGVQLQEEVQLLGFS